MRSRAQKRKRANSCEFWPGSVPLVLLVSLEIVCLGVTIVTHQARFVKSLCCFCQSKHNLGVVKWWLHRCAAVIVGTGQKPPDPPKYHRGSPTRQPTLEATLCQLLRSPAGRGFFSRRRGLGSPSILSGLRPRAWAVVSVPSMSLVTLYKLFTKVSDKHFVNCVFVR